MNNNTLFLIYILLLFTQCTKTSQHVIYSDEESILSTDKIEIGDYKTEALSNDYLLSTTTLAPNKTHEEVWKLSSNIKKIPKYKSGEVLIDAMYYLSLDLLNKSDFYTKKPRYTTKDISNSVILSLSIVDPKRCMDLLLSRVSGNTIKQDSGQGGSWPINTDRILWTIASWEVYKNTGDIKWLNKIYRIIKTSIDTDLNVIWNSENHLFRGKSTIDKDYYPKWMNATDIFESYSLNIQILYYKNLKILAEIGNILNKDVVRYTHISSALKKSINDKLWLENHKYYAQLIYNNKNNIVSQRSDALGEAWSILYGVAGKTKAKQIISNTPMRKHGVYTTYPNGSVIDSISDTYIQAYWNWASAKTKNYTAVKKGILLMIKNAAINLNNPTHYYTEKFHKQISESNIIGISSSLSNIYRIILGLNYTSNYLEFSPFIARNYSIKRSIQNLKYRDAILDIEIIGFGDEISTFSIDGKFKTKARVGKLLKGKHIIEIKMKNSFCNNNENKVADKSIMPKTAILKLKNDTLHWNTNKNTKKSIIYINGEKHASTKENYIKIKKSESPLSYSIYNVSSKGIRSYLSKAYDIYESDNKRIIHLNKTISKTKTPDYSFAIRTVHNGEFYISFKYSNGNGSKLSGYKCGLRSFWKEKTYIGTIVFPQTGGWEKYQMSNALKVKMIKGMNNFSLLLKEYNKNMSNNTNDAKIIEIHIMALDK